MGVEVQRFDGVVGTNAVRGGEVGKTRPGGGFVGGIPAGAESGGNEAVVNVSGDYVISGAHVCCWVAKCYGARPRPAMSRLRHSTLSISIGRQWILLAKHALCRYYATHSMQGTDNRSQFLKGCARTLVLRLLSQRAM